MHVPQLKWVSKRWHIIAAPWRYFSQAFLFMYVNNQLLGGIECIKDVSYLFLEERVAV